MINMPFWEEDIIVGGNFTGNAGNNTITIKPGGNISLIVSEKYLAGLTLYLDSVENDDRLEKLAVTNSTNEKTIASNIPLMQTTNVEFTSPRYIPTDWWISASVHLNSTKRVVVYTEILDNPQEEI